MSKFIPCRLCANKEGPSPGYYFVKQNGVQFVQECECHALWAQQKQLSRALKNANIWQTLYNKNSYVGNESRENLEHLQKYIDKFEDKFSDKAVYFYGGNGTQKTTIAMWVAQQLILKGVDVYYTLMETLTTSLLPDFNNPSSDKVSIADRAKNAELLIVDEAFDRSKQTLYKSGYHIPFIDKFIRERIDVFKKATIFISNKDPQSISEQGYGDSLQSLITRNVKESTLTFKDVYIQNINVIDSKGLFR